VLKASNVIKRYLDNVLLAERLQCYLHILPGNARYFPNWTDCRRNIARLSMEMLFV
jgi:hypothetical protein